MTLAQHMRGRRRRPHRARSYCSSALTRVPKAAAASSCRRRPPKAAVECSRRRQPPDAAAAGGSCTRPPQTAAASGFRRPMTKTAHTKNSNPTNTSQYKTNVKTTPKQYVFCHKSQGKPCFYIERAPLNEVSVFRALSSCQNHSKSAVRISRAAADCSADWQNPRLTR